MPSPLATQRSLTHTGASSTPGLSLPVRATLDLLNALNSNDGTAVNKAALTFLGVYRNLLAGTDTKFAKAMLSRCLDIRFSQRPKESSLAGSDLTALPCLPEDMTNGLRKVQLTTFYQSASGLLPMDVMGVRAFQRDYLTHLETMISTVRQKSEISPPFTRAFEQLAGIVLRVSAKESPSPVFPKQTSAMELAHLLVHLEKVDLPSLQCAVSALAIRDNFISLRAAVDPLLNRVRGNGITISTEMERDLTAWAALNQPFNLSTLPFQERCALLRNLRVGTSELLKSERRDLLEREWFAKSQEAQQELEHLLDIADGSVASPDPLLQYPDVTCRFARALRLTMRELNDLKQALEVLERHQFTRLSVELDQSLFTWPRMAETFLVTKPSKVTLYSPTANDSGETPTEPNPKPFLCQRDMHVIPLSLTTPAKRIVEDDLRLVSKRPVEWDSHSIGELNVEGEKISVRIDPTLQVMDTVRAVAPHIKPYSNCFVIRDPSATPSAPPLALGVFFPERLKDIPGHKTYTFGKTVQLFIAHAPEETCHLKPEPLNQPTIPEKSEVGIAPPTATTQTAPQAATTLNSSGPPTAQVEPPSITPAPRPEATFPKKVKKAPPPPPIRDPRPRVQPEQSLVAKTALAAIPEIQASARASNALKPALPFTDPDILTTLHILKNGEKPGNKALKALRAYVAEDSNFKDAIRSQSVRLVRANLERLAAELLG